MSSSESEGGAEERARFREAIDPQFNQGTSKPAGGKASKKPSLRRDHLTDEAATNDANGLRVTPEFRDYVAKKLDESIQRRVKEERLRFSFEDDNDLHEEGCGIRLFSTSEGNVRVSENHDTQDQSKTKKRREKPDLLAHRKSKKKKVGSITKAETSGSDSDSDVDVDLSAVAVDAKWVLEKKGVYS